MIKAIAINLQHEAEYVHVEKVCSNLRAVQYQT